MGTDLLAISPFGGRGRPGSVHGMWAPIRQFLVTAKPWQRMVLGLVVIAVGVLLGNYVITAFGVVFVVLPAAGWVKRRRAGGLGPPHAGEQEVGAADDQPADAAEG